MHGETVKNGMLVGTLSWII